jgi:hypothetical protein
MRTKKEMVLKKTSIESTLIHKALHDQLSFRPAPPGDVLEDSNTGLALLQQTIEIDASEQELADVLKALQSGALTIQEISRAVKTGGLPAPLRQQLLDAAKRPDVRHESKDLSHKNDLRHKNKPIDSLHENKDPLHKNKPIDSLHENKDSLHKNNPIDSLHENKDSLHKNNPIDSLHENKDPLHKNNPIDSLHIVHELDYLATFAVNMIARLHDTLLRASPLVELHFHFSSTAKAVLALGWEAMLKRGIFPIPPQGNERIKALHSKPLGAMHFVSASDLDAGYHYTMGVALSPEAQSLGTTNVSYGLDGELIVPGQAVSPIPPFLAMGTRLFSAGIAVSSNISEEVQSIPMRNYPHPTANKDLKPIRSGIYQPPERFDTLDQLISDLKQQLWKNAQTQPLSSSQTNKRFIDHKMGNFALPPIKAVLEITEMTPDKIRYWVEEVLKEKDLADHRKEIALYLNIETTRTHRISRVNEIVDIASEFGFKYVAIADNEKDEWLPNLLEYLEPYELNAIADHSDLKGVVVIDGRPVDPIYTAATSAQRIQSVYTTLSADILKMGMWLCLDALSARMVYRELLSHPHISNRMLLMPIGIVEPWNAFVDNRNTDKTPRAIIDPFEKIKFMIEEARELGIPSLLTDTRHKETWVLLGRKTDEDEPHPREDFMRDPITNTILCRTEKSAIPLLSWEEFMECERLARQAGIFLGQAGSIETFQLFRIISETTYDAAKEGKDPATGIWTAETERVLSTQNNNALGMSLQSQRSAAVSPFLAIINRGFESHAKLDGWLHYLNDQHKGSDVSLREKLEQQRTNVNTQLLHLLEAQAKWRHHSEQEQEQTLKAHYQETWDQFYNTYLDYHRLIKDNFFRIRNQVEKMWSASTHNKKVQTTELEKE